MRRLWDTVTCLKTIRYNVLRQKNATNLLNTLWLHLHAAMHLLFHAFRFSARPGLVQSVNFSKCFQYFLFICFTLVLGVHFFAFWVPHGCKRGSKEASGSSFWTTKVDKICPRPWMWEYGSRAINSSVFARWGLAHSVQIPLERRL